MNYSHITGDMTWSHSRIKCYEDCPYRFLLRYITREKTEGLFFAEFGSYLHHIYQKYLDGDLPAENLAAYYIGNFRAHVKCRAPKNEMFAKYYRAGLDAAIHVPDLIEPGEKILGVEKSVVFSLGDNSFCGFIDLVTEDEQGNITVTDHKSRDLKPFSSRKTPTKSDEELHRYFRQLYLYSAAIYAEYGRFPTYLRFNCFKTGQKIKQEFHESEYEQALDWANETIEQIHRERAWKPNLDWFSCRYICDVHHACDYFLLNEN